MFRARCLFPIVAFCLATLTMQAQDEMTATYIHHALEITVPYQGVHQGAGRLEVTLLSPEDKVLARSRECRARRPPQAASGKPNSPPTTQSRSTISSGSASAAASSSKASERRR